MYVIKVWSEYVFGKCDSFILQSIVEQQYDMYLLCNIDLPWEKDELRENPQKKDREEIWCMYNDILINQKTPWALISGYGENRLNNALTFLKMYLNQID